MKKYNIAIVGATGLVGRTFIKVIEEYQLNIDQIHFFASINSIGKEVIFNGKTYFCEELKEGAFCDIDFALFSAGAAVSSVWAKVAANEGAIVIDNSSYFRMDPNCALIVPEININDYKNKSKIIANPNCSTIQSVLPLKPLDDLYHIKSINYTTYQAVSGSGKKGLDDYERCMDGKRNEFYPYNITKTVIPEIDSFLDDGYTKEEMKMVNETKKILHNDEIRISATCVRVPIMYSHAVSISIQFKDTPNINEIRDALRNYPGIMLLDDVKNHIYPVATISTNTDLVYVGRIRYDLSKDNAILIYTVGDNVRKGAASNAVQIMKAIMEDMENEGL